jgi:hypothetical protein
MFCKCCCRMKDWAAVTASESTSAWGPALGYGCHCQYGAHRIRQRAGRRGGRPPGPRKHHCPSADPCHKRSGPTTPAGTWGCECMCMGRIPSVCTRHCGCKAGARLSPVFATGWIDSLRAQPACRTTHSKNLRPLGSSSAGFSTLPTLLAFKACRGTESCAATQSPCASCVSVRLLPPLLGATRSAGST